MKTAAITATILAALRNWQISIEGGMLDHIENDPDNQFRDHFADVTPLTADEIDTLCESINFGEVPAIQDAGIRFLHDTLSNLIEDPHRDLYAETILPLTADYLAAIAPHLSACRTPAAESEATSPLLAALKSAELSTTQIRLAANIGKKTLRNKLSWYESQLEQLGREIRQAIDSSQPVTPQPEESEDEDEDPDAQAIRDLATDQHCSDIIQIYPDAKLSHGDDNGCYVEAWVWCDFSGTPYDKEAESETA